MPRSTGRVCAPPDPTTLFPIAELRRIAPSRPHRNTIAAWCDRGVAGQRLRYKRIGGWRYTCLNWFEDFNRAIEEART